MEIQQSDGKLSKLWARDDKLRMESATLLVVFDGDTLTAADTSAKTAWRIDRAIAAETARTLREARKDPLVQKMIEGMGKPTITKTDESSAVRGVPCTIHRYIWGEIRRDFCMAAESDVTGAKQVLSALREMADIFGELAASIDMLGALNGARDIDGIAIRTQDYRDGAVSSEATVTRAELSDMPSTMFTAPSYPEQPQQQ